MRDPQALADSQYLGHGQPSCVSLMPTATAIWKLPLKSGKTLRIITNPELVTNKYLDKDDNAALALYATGRAVK